VRDIFPKVVWSADNVRDTFPKVVWSADNVRDTFPKVVWSAESVRENFPKGYNPSGGRDEEYGRILFLSVNMLFLFIV
jgi:hypothetical protein